MSAGIAPYSKSRHDVITAFGKLSCKIFSSIRAFSSRFSCSYNSKSGHFCYRQISSVPQKQWRIQFAILVYCVTKLCRKLFIIKADKSNTFRFTCINNSVSIHTSLFKFIKSDFPYNLFLHAFHDGQKFFYMFNIQTFVHNYGTNRKNLLWSNTFDTNFFKTSQCQNHLF